MSWAEVIAICYILIVWIIDRPAKKELKRLGRLHPEGELDPVVPLEG